MTSAGLLDRIISSLSPLPPTKASVGVGTSYYATGMPLSAMMQDPRSLMRAAQDAYVSNRHIRKAERLISQRFGTVEYHLELPDDTEVDDDSPGPYQAILELLEKPYRPQPGDPLTQTPRTRADLWSLTSRHMGVCGTAFWYLDQTDALAGLPLQILYINPARMTPATNDSGQLTGWVLDDDNRGGGTPLDLKAVIPFYLEPPDSGWFGTGLVASALSMVDLTRRADQHASGVLASGGRLAGMVAPKGDATIPDDVYVQLTRDFRRAAENPDSARRINILRGPVEFTRTSATPAELDLVAIMQLSRDEVAELWGVPRSQMGGQTPQGLNGGDSKGYDEAILWQNAVSPRLRSFAETVQYRLLDLYAAAGLAVELEVDEPEFDDETPRFDRAQKAAVVPMKNSERRELLGLDPFGDERDEEVWMASSMARVYPEAATPAPLLPFTGRPDPSMDPNAMPTDPAEAVDALNAAKADLSVPMRRTVAEVLATFGKQVAAKVRDRADHLARKPSDIAAVFDPQKLEDALSEALRPHYAAAMAAAATEVERRVNGKADLREPVVDRLLRAAGVRIKGISETTRQRVADIVRQGLDEGLSAAELGDRIEAASGLFDELRAETIARTETATVLNQAAVAQYADFGVDRVTVVDGDEDDACASADGQVWTLDRAEAEPIAHPNCVRTFTPLVGAPAARASLAKAAPVEDSMPTIVIHNHPQQDANRVEHERDTTLAALKAVTSMAAEMHGALAALTSPVITVAPASPTITVAPSTANFDIHVPEAPPAQIVMPPAKADAPLVQDIRIVSLPPMNAKVRRDSAGRLSSIEDDQ